MRKLVRKLVGLGLFQVSFPNWSLGPDNNSLLINFGQAVASYQFDAQTSIALRDFIDQNIKS